MSSRDPRATTQAPPEEAGSGESPKINSSFDTLLDVSMPVIIEIGRTNLTVQEILSLSIGSVVRLDRLVGDPVDVYVSDRKLAEGEIVVVGDHFGVRITRVVGGSDLEAAA